MDDVQFQTECTTGVVHIRNRPNLYFCLDNRSDKDEWFEITLLMPYAMGESHEPRHLYTTGPLPVRRGMPYVGNYNPLDVDDPCWNCSLIVRIKLTSDLLVPSVHFLQGDALEPNQSVAAHYGPEDFARFDLRRAPVIGTPPVDPPVESAE